MASRAAFVAALMDDRKPDRDSALWLGTIGYRVGLASGWANVCQLRQGALLRVEASGTHVEHKPFAPETLRDNIAGVTGVTPDDEHYAVPTGDGFDGDF